jgi:hypothetical protein
MPEYTMKRSKPDEGHPYIGRNEVGSKIRHTKLNEYCKTQKIADPTDA